MVAKRKERKVRIKPEFRNRYDSFGGSVLTVIEGTTLGIAVKVQNRNGKTRWIDQNHLEEAR